MPIYSIQAPDGRSFDLEGDSPPTEQELEDVFASLPKAGLKASTQETIANQEAARQAIIQREQRPASQKVLQAAGAVPGAIMDFGGRLLGGIPQIPTFLSQPETILPTVGEAARRTGVDIVRLGEMLLPKNAQDLGAIGMGPSAQIVNAIKGLAPRTPTESDIQAELDTVPLLGRAEDISTEREKIAFEGANPAVSESLAQTIQLASPIKGVQALKAVPKGVSGLGRAIRSAVKPPTKGNIGMRLENAANTEGAEIFLRNPNADKLAATPFEGFANEVSGALQEAGDKLSELRALSKSTLNAGDQIADKMEAKAAALVREGNKDIADELLQIAARKRGTMQDINSLQGAVTLANRKPNILRLKTDAQGFADEIISKDGGDLINQEMATVGGEAGEGARKKWANLKLLNDNVQERLNKIINSAPVDAQPALLEALASPEGVAGMFALMNGWTGAGALALGVKGVQKWARKEVSNLKNSNKIIQRKYDELRKSPPPAPVRPAGAQPPPIPQVSPEAPFLAPDTLAEQISRSISGTTPSSVPISQIPIEQALVGQFVPQRSVAGFSPPPGTAIPPEILAQQALNQALSRQIGSTISRGASVQPPAIPQIPMEQALVGQAIPARSVPGFSPSGGPVVPPEILQQQILNQAISEQVARTISSGTPIIPGAIPQTALEAALVREGIAIPSVAGFNPRPGVVGAPEMGAVEAARARQIAINLAETARARQAQDLAVAMAEALSRGSRVPRIFLPTAP